jgi:hypothetical protein
MGKLFWMVAMGQRTDRLPSFERIEPKRKIKEITKFNLGIFYFEEDEADEQMMNLDEFLSF